jgi:hypothetical protein
MRYERLVILCSLFAILASAAPAQAVAHQICKSTYKPDYRKFERILSGMLSKKVTIKTGTRERRNFAANLDPKKDSFFCCDAHGCHGTNVINLFLYGPCPVITLACNDLGLCVPIGPEEPPEPNEP